MGREVVILPPHFHARRVMETLKRVVNSEAEDAVELKGMDLEGEWTDPPAPDTIPVEEDEYIRNVRYACKLDLPNVNYQYPHDKIMVMVCGGPTAKLYLDEIRARAKSEKYHVFCSNKTHDWLIENGIIPYAHFIIDPKKSKVEDVKHPHPDVRYMLGVNCHPDVFRKLSGYNVSRLMTVCGAGKGTEEKILDLHIIKASFASDEYALLEGGSMAGLRAMTLANVLGYRTVEFYGFDSCYFDTDDDGYPVFYSYDKSRAENILEAQTESGRIYMTTPVFSSQARQFIKWKHRLSWIKFIVHGDSLTSEINRIDEEKHQLKGILISEYMRQMNRELHKNKSFGAGKDIDVGMSTHAGRMAVLAGQFLKKQSEVTILDYGCGKGMFSEMMPPIFGVSIHEYDPCMEGKDKRPEPSDIVVALDVLEHVEPDLLDDVLNDLEQLTKLICYVSINTKPSIKYYSDGQNTHLITENREWWSPRLKKYFDITEEHVTKTHYTAVLQKRGLTAKSGNGGVSWT